MIMASLAPLTSRMKSTPRFDIAISQSVGAAGCGELTRYSEPAKGETEEPHPRPGTPQEAGRPAPLRMRRGASRSEGERFQRGKTD